MNRRELEMLLNDLFDGWLDGDDFERLQDELRNNPAARQAYRESAHLEHALRFRAKGVDLLHVIPMERVVARRHRRVLRHAVGAAAALVVLGALVMALLLARTPQPTLSFRVSPGSDWMISHAVAAGERPEGQTMEPGSRLMMEHGVVELNLATGVRGMVRGPLDMTLLREDLIDLKRGTVWFKVPENAVGFQVRTPDLVLTDLGTAFGIHSKDNFLDEVHVFEGEVEVLHRRGFRNAERIKAGAARAANPVGRWNGIPPRPDDFLTKLPTSSQVPVEMDDAISFTTSPVNEMVKKGEVRFSSVEDLAGFDPKASDKLVVTLSHERGQVEMVTYGGVRMLLSEYAANGTGLQRTSIYHLDRPGAAADLVVRFRGTTNRGGWFAVRALKHRAGRPGDDGGG